MLDWMGEDCSEGLDDPVRAKDSAPVIRNAGQAGASPEAPLAVEALACARTAAARSTTADVEQDVRQRF
jgi:hypothetical protein